MDIVSLITNVGILFIMMLPGVILKKCNFCNDTFGKGISNLVLHIAQPALIVYAYLSCKSTFADIWRMCLYTFILSIIVHVIFSVISLALFKKSPESERKMLRFATIFSNAAFMGIPLIEAILGAEAAIYASIYNITYNFFLWTLGVHLCTHREGVDLDSDGDYDTRDKLISAHRSMKKEASIMKVLLHPVTLASVIGLIALICGVGVAGIESAKLSIVSDSLYMLKGLVAPLSMVVIGIRLADMNLKGLFNDVGMYIFLVMRHLALPLAVLAAIFLVNLVGIKIPETVSTVTLLLAAAPAAASATMFAEKYDCDAIYTSRLVVVSTIISIATMPLIMVVANAIL